MSKSNIKNKAKTPFNLPALPPKVDYSILVEDLGRAHASLARLDEILKHLVNPALIERTFLTREAVLSSQIEGTQATLEEVFKKEAEEGQNPQEDTTKGQDIREIINYRKAIREGARLVENGESLAENNIKDLHRILLQSVRGRTKSPGEFRREQVWIGPPGTPMSEARYVPPSPVRVAELYSNFDRYLNTDKAERDPLVQVAIAHYQFEAIHPFKDGNGRLGRLLIPLFLYKRNKINKPYIYVSKYLEEHRKDYYELLAKVSYEGDWISWIRFFLLGLCTQAEEASVLARKITEMQARLERRLSEFKSPYAFSLLEAIFAYPIFTTTQLRKISNIKNIQTSTDLVKKFVAAGILEDLTPERKRNKTYGFKELLNLLESFEVED